MSLPEVPEDTPEPIYALTRSNDLVLVGDGVTEDAVEITDAATDDARPTTVPTSQLELLPAGTTYQEAVRLKLARAGMPITTQPV